MQDSEINISSASINEAEIITCFQVKMAQETENLQLEKEIVLKGVTTVFKDKSKGQYYVAKVDEKVVGSLLITYEWSDWRCSTVLWIQSVFVIEKYRRKGVFSLFYNFLKDKVKSSNGEYSGIRLYVDKTNIAGQKTYDRVGMNSNHYSLYENMTL